MHSSSFTGAKRTSDDANNDGGATCFSPLQAAKRSCLGNTEAENHLLQSRTSTSASASEAEHWSQSYTSDACGTGLDEEEGDACIEHWRTREITLQPSAARIWQLQNEVTPQMRQTLVDWLFEVASDFSLTRETFFLSVNYVDRYLARNRVSRAEFQLVGVTCLWLAAKYEEVHPPQVKQLVDMTNNTYQISQMITMGNKVLAALEFELGAPTALKFMEYFMQEANTCSSASSKVVALHLLELTTLVSVPAIPSATMAGSIPTHVQQPQGTARHPDATQQVAVTRPVLTLKEPIAAHAAFPLSPASASNASSATLHVFAATPSCSHPCTPEAGQEAASADPHHPQGPTPAAAAAAPSVLPQQPGDFSCLAAALPSHTAAAALLAAAMLQRQHSRALLVRLAGLAQCHPEYLLQLTQTLCRLRDMLSASSNNCAIMTYYQVQWLLEQRQVRQKMVQALQRQQQQQQLARAAAACAAAALL